MPSQLPESTVKPMSKTKPLNPHAEPFRIQSPAAQPHCRSRSTPPLQICGGQLECQVTEAIDIPPPEHQPVFLPVPESTQAVGVFPHSGCWYAHPLAAYQPCTFWFCTLLHHPVDNHGHGTHMARLGNEETHGSDLGAGKTHKRVLVERSRLCQGYGKKRTVAQRSRVEWRAKEAKGKPTEKNTGGCTVRRPIIPFPPTVEEAESSATTTVMIRNIPNQYQFKDLLLMLDECCRELNKNADPTVRSKFDFVYLPMDYRKHARQGRMSNLGYAFVNFTSASAAFKFYQQLQGFAWDDPENRKTCEITTAQFQGKEALTRIFHQKVFRCESREFLPVVFSDGRDGFNRRIKGTFLGKYVRGLPRRGLGNSASSYNQ